MSAKTFLLMLLMAASLALPALATDDDEDEGSRGKGYLDLLMREKAEIRTLAFNRKQCFFAKVRELDNGIIMPQILAQSLLNECSEHEKIIRSHLKNTLKMNDNFIHDFIRTVQEDVLTSLVPYILKHRKEQRQKRGELW